MRTAWLSKTALDQLNALLAQGVEPFGVRVVAEKRDRSMPPSSTFWQHTPRSNRPHPRLGLCVYPIFRTPFVVLYDFDDAELRVHFIFHRHSDFRDLDPTSAAW